jgi:hypothetical protein
LIKEREETELEKPVPDTAIRETEPEPQVEQAPEAAASVMPSSSQHEPINFLEDEQDLSFPRKFHDLQSAPNTGSAIFAFLERDGGGGGGGYYPPFPPQQYDHTGMANHCEPVAVMQQQHAHALAQQQQHHAHSHSQQQQQHGHAHGHAQQQHEAYQQHNAFAPPSVSFHLPGQMPHPHPPNFDRRHGLYQEFMNRYQHNY